MTIYHPIDASIERTWQAFPDGPASVDSEDVQLIASTRYGGQLWVRSRVSPPNAVDGQEIAVAGLTRDEVWDAVHVLAAAGLHRETFVTSEYKAWLEDIDVIVDRRDDWSVTQAMVDSAPLPLHVLSLGGIWTGLIKVPGGSLVLHGFFVDSGTVQLRSVRDSQLSTFFADGSADTPVPWQVDNFLPSLPELAAWARGNRGSGAAR